MFYYIYFQFKITLTLHSLYLTHKELHRDFRTLLYRNKIAVMFTCDIFEQNKELATLDTSLVDIANCLRRSGAEADSHVCFF